MPFASISKVTSICGRPRGAGGMSVEVELAERLVAARHVGSPCRTWIVTAPWLSSRSRNCFALVGMVVFLVDELGHHPAERLDAERNGRHVEQQHVLDVALRVFPACSHAPMATASSRCVLPRLLAKNSRTLSITLGMRVWPPNQDFGR